MTTIREGRVVIRPAPLVRVMGAWTLVLSSFIAAMVVAPGTMAAVDSRDTAGTAVYLLVFAPMILWFGRDGLRLLRLSVVADPQGLTIRNRFRTRVVGWSDVDSIEFEKRSGGWWHRLNLMWRRSVAVVRLVDGTEIDVDAAETYWWIVDGRLFAGSVAAARSRTDALRASRRRFVGTA